jgi:hypothetical protein
MKQLEPSGMTVDAQSLPESLPLVPRSAGVWLANIVQGPAGANPRGAGG